MRSIKWGLLLLVNVSYWLNIHFTSMLFGSFLSEDAGKSVEKLLGYASSEVSYGFSFGYFERTFTIVLFTCFYKELKKYGKSGAIFYNCSLLYYVLHILFSDVGVLAQRFSLLFVVGYWVNYSNIFCSNRVNKIVKYFILILLMMKVVVSYLTIDAKYQNVIFGVDSYDKRVYEVFYK
jgi:hypothetical protein